VPARAIRELGAAAVFYFYFVPFECIAASKSAQVSSGLSFQAYCGALNLRFRRDGI
jgi:hypothetical protein